MAGRATRVLHGKVVKKHKNDYPNCRDKGCMYGGNVRYDRKNPTKGMYSTRGFIKPVVLTAEDFALVA
jgi:hypothetical protein